MQRSLLNTAVIKPSNSDDKCRPAPVPVKVQGAYLLRWRNPFIHCHTQEVIPLHIPLLTQVVPLLWAAFLLKDDYPEWCRAGGKKIDQNNDIPGRGSRCTLFPSALLTNWVTSSPHPLFTADRPLLASMDLIIIPMSILNMWHKFHHRGLSIEGRRRATKAPNKIQMYGYDSMMWGGK